MNGNKKDKKSESSADIPEKIKIINLVIGITATIISFLIIFKPSTGIDIETLLNQTSLPLFIISLGMMITSLFDENLRNLVRGVLFFLGLVIAVLCVLIFLFRVFTPQFFIMAIILLFIVHGTVKIIRGIMGKRKDIRMSSLRRVFFIKIGILTVLLALLALSLLIDISPFLAILFILITVILNEIGDVILIVGEKMNYP